MLRWTILALALGPLFYYLLGIYSAWQFFFEWRMALRRPHPLPQEYWRLLPIVAS